jgi:uncharacterized membrane protein
MTGARDVLIGLLGAQLTLIGVIYPLVFALTTAVMKLQAGDSDKLRSFLYNTAAIPVALSSFALVATLAIALVALPLPYQNPSGADLALIGVALDGAVAWFLLNVLSAAVFGYQALGFLDHRRRIGADRAYLSRVVWPAVANRRASTSRDGIAADDRWGAGLLADYGREAARHAREGDDTAFKTTLEAMVELHLLLFKLAAGNACNASPRAWAEAYQRVFEAAFDGAGRSLQLVTDAACVPAKLIREPAARSGQAGLTSLIELGPRWYAALYFALEANALGDAQHGPLRRIDVPRAVAAQATSGLRSFIRVWEESVDVLACGKGTPQAVRDHGLLLHLEKTVWMAAWAIQSGYHDGHRRLVDSLLHWPRAMTRRLDHLQENQLDCARYTVPLAFLSATRTPALAPGSASVSQSAVARAAWMFAANDTALMLALHLLRMMPEATAQSPVAEALRALILGINDKADIAEEDRPGLGTSCDVLCGLLRLYLEQIETFPKSHWDNLTGRMRDLAETDWKFNRIRSGFSESWMTAKANHAMLLRLAPEAQSTLPHSLKEGLKWIIENNQSWRTDLLAALSELRRAVAGLDATTVGTNRNTLQLVDPGTSCSRVIDLIDAAIAALGPSTTP